MEEHLNAESLLRNADWMNVLARALVSDQGLAEDVVQETWLAVLRRPPALLTQAWLRRVVKNLANRSHRTEYTRRRLERVVSRAEHAVPATENMVERVEVQRQVVGVVLELEEPFRSTVLLRYFEGLKPVEIASKSRTPVTTVRSRLKKALELLRTRLDRANGGNRQAWCGVLLPLVGSALGGPPSVAQGASTVAVATSKGVATTSMSIGGAAMTSKSVVGVALVCTTSLAVGIGLGHFGAAPSPTADQGQSGIEIATRPNLAAELERAQGELAKMRDEKNLLASVNRNLRQQVNDLRKSAATQETEKTEESQEHGVYRSGLPWSSFAGVLAEAVQPMAKRFNGEELTIEEQETLNLLHGELIKASARAKARSSAPFFDKDIFPDLVTSLLKDSLGLTEEQLDRLSGLNEEILELIPDNVTELSPLETLRLRQEMASWLWDGVEGMITEDQVEGFDTVKTHAEHIAFAYGGVVEAGVSHPGRNFASNWVTSLLPEGEKPSIEAVQPIASRFLADAREVLERYGQTDADIESLPEDARSRLDEETWSLQERYEKELYRLLNDDQKGWLFSKEPLLVRFKFGSSLMTSMRRSWF